MSLPPSDEDELENFVSIFLIEKPIPNPIPRAITTKIIVNVIYFVRDLAQKVIHGLSRVSL
jgi:hypothetical protein